MPTLMPAWGWLASARLWWRLRRSSVCWMPVCSSCGRESVGDFTFCPYCATPFVATPCVLASLGARDPGSGQRYRAHH